MKSSKHQTPNSKEAPNSKLQAGFAAFENRCHRAQSCAQGEFKKGAGTASSSRLDSSTAFYGDEPSPPLLARVVKRTLLTQAQAELSLDAVKPVRNDLSDSDLQIVPARLEIKPEVLKTPRPRLLKPELTGFAWSRLTARVFNSERVRA